MFFVRDSNLFDVHFDNLEDAIDTASRINDHRLSEDPETYALVQVIHMVNGEEEEILY